jgi:putative FmdB family regulatory protein
MPLYEYQCSKCEDKKEAVQSIKDEPLKICEKSDCGGDLKKLISLGGFELKGSGWAKDLYSKKP